MSELLIRNVDNVNLSASAEKQKRGLYKRGDIVTVLLDGHRYGGKETLPRFVILQLPGVSIDFVRRYFMAEQGRGERIQVNVPEAQIGDVAGFIGIDEADLFDFEETGSAVGGLIPVDAYVLATVTRRLFRVLLDEFPLRVKNELNTVGKSSTSFSDIKSCIENKTTRQTEASRVNP